MLKFTKAAIGKWFSSLEVLLSKEQPKTLGKLEDWDYKTACRFFKNDLEHQKLLKIAKELDTMMDKCGLMTKCKAIFTDGDIVAYMPDYFKTTSEQKGVISVSWGIHV